MRTLKMLDSSCNWGRLPCDERAIADATVGVFMQPLQHASLPPAKLTVPAIRLTGVRTDAAF
jgi:hypothetical protein